jgi:hypothetical protein
VQARLILALFVLKFSLYLLFKNISILIFSISNHNCILSEKYIILAAKLVKLFF